MMMIQARQHRTLTELTSNQQTVPAAVSAQPLAKVLQQAKSPYATSPSLEELSEGSAFSFKTFVQKTARRASLSFSNPSLTKTPHDPNRRPSDGGRELKLINSHIFYSEMQFIMTLVDISDRLRSVPKPARQSTLIAELTLLNHNLPADVYIPFGCAGVKKQHRVARISLTDCVVLNSADRVPFLMMVEVFEPTEGALPSMDELKLEKEKVELNIITLRPEISIDSSDSGRPSPIKFSCSPDSKFLIDTGKSIDLHHMKSISAEYHLSVLSRRRSAVQLAVPEAERAINKDAFSERMRTAGILPNSAVMLAQLYKQQQKNITLDISSPNKSPPRNRKGSDNPFEEIRARVIKEMMMLEQQRLETLVKTIGDAAGVEDVLTPGKEQQIENLASVDQEDPSGISH
jgi:phosphatidylinositol 4-kinase B